MIITENGPKSIGQICKQFTSGNLFLSPEEYQRENSWGMSQKQLLIDTIFRRMDIPKFYLWKIDQQTLSEGYPDGETKVFYKELLEKKRRDNDDHDPYIYEVVDGQQRIRTILEFMGIVPPNEKCYRGIWNPPFLTLSDTPIAKGKSYSQLNADQQIMFDETPLSVMILEKAKIDEIRDMFLRLQNGTPLKAQQKRDAMGSSVGKFAKELAEMPFFKVSVNFDNNESTHNLVASQMILLEIKEKIYSCTSVQLDRFYEQYKKAPLDNAVVTRIRKIVSILGKIFPSKCNHLNQNYALSLYWLISRILTTYEIPEDQYIKIKDNFERLDLKRIEARNRDFNNKPQDEDYEELTLAMSRGNTGVDGISTRHDIIGRFIFEGVKLKEKPNLDPQRVFTHEEKLILFHQSGGRCQLEHKGKICGRQITFDEAVVDHIKPYSLGGRTELANGRIAYKFCNISRGNKDTFDPESDCHFIKSIRQGESE